MKEITVSEDFNCYGPQGLMQHSWLVANGPYSDMVIGDVVEEQLRNTTEGVYHATITIRLERLRELP